EGRPVPGAVVSRYPNRETVTSDADGRFAFEDLERRRYAVCARKDDLISQHEFFDPDEARELFLRMGFGTTFIARVLGNRVPVVGARLVLEKTVTAVSGEDGTLTFRGLAPGWYDGRLSADGWADERVSFTVEHDPGGTIERELKLHPACRVEGVVLD